MNQRILLYLLLTAASCMGLRCQHEPDDAVPVRTPAKADFLIEEKVGDRWFTGDSIQGNNLIRFTATQPCDSLVWTLGSETIRTRSFTRTLFPDGQWITVRLVCYRKADPAYFPFDDGVDTVLRKFYSWPPQLDDYVYKEMPVLQPPKKFWVPQVQRYYPIYGTYRGRRATNPNQEITVTVLDTFKYIPPSPGSGLNQETYWQTTILSNLTYPDFRMCDRAPSGYFNNTSPKAIYVNQPAGTCAQNGHARWPGLIGYAWLVGGKELHFDYQYQDTLTGQWVKDYFSGTRLW